MFNFKNHCWPKKWYGHGRTAPTADDGPVSNEMSFKELKFRMIMIKGYAYKK